MKKIKINPRSLPKIILSVAMFALYWYWVNHKLLPDTAEPIGLGMYFFLMSFSTAFFPLPANLLTLGAVKFYEPWLVALVAGGATLVAYFLEYHFFGMLFRFKKVARVKESWIYKKMRPLFTKHQFFILTFVSFLPISSEPIRLYAISIRYSLLSFVLAGCIGRIPRYFLLGYYGKPYVSSIWFIVAVILFPAAFLLFLKGGTMLLNFLKTKVQSGNTPVSVTVPTTSLAPDLDDSELV